MTPDDTAWLKVMTFFVLFGLPWMIKMAISIAQLKSQLNTFSKGVAATRRRINTKLQGHDQDLLHHDRRIQKLENRHDRSDRQGRGGRDGS